LSVLAVGLAAAVGAAMCFNVGVALQALEARDAPVERAMRLSLLAVLGRRPRWGVGVCLSAVGVLLEVVAFADAPFVVVQATLAAGLLVLLFAGARVLDERVGIRHLGGVLALVLGIGLVAYGVPGGAETSRRLALAAAVVGGLTLLALVPFALRRRHEPVMLVILGAAVAVSASSIATKLMADRLGAHQIALAIAWLVVAGITGVAGLIGNMSALQRCPATRLVPISFAVQTFLPIALGPTFLRERWSALRLAGLPLGGGLALTLVGILIVASARAVNVVAAAAERS
jgi:drug/metabolite transporter (DMT)-like permease